MQLDRASNEQLKELQAKVNAERKKFDLEPLTMPQIVASCIEFVGFQKMPYIGSVYIRN